MYENQPVLIPVTDGKITFKKKRDSEYVYFQTGREYDPVRKYNIPQRKIIGIRIPTIPEMMLPNENYFEYIRGGDPMNTEQEKTAKTYEKDRKQFLMLRDLFEQMYYEFQLQSRRKPDEVLNAYKVSKINSILEPLREMMAGEDYGKYLDLIDPGVPGKKSDEAGGRTYSDIALMLTQYKGAMKRFSSERM